MNVVYTRRFFEGKKVKFAVVDEARVAEKHTELFTKVRDLTFSLTSRMITPIVEGKVMFYNTIDDAMNDSLDYDLIFIQSVGNLIKSNILLEQIEKYSIDNPDFFTLAFTLDWQSEKGAGWVEIHHQMMFVNINKWKEIGSPKFGGWDTVTEELPNYIRSEENFHDRYTPYWMKGAEGTTIGTRTSQGYGFLKAAFANGIKIDNFTDEMRKCRLFIYPESDTDNLYEAFIKRNTKLVSNSNQKKWIKSFKLAPTIWVYNSERYYFHGDKKCDTYFGTASGFKYLDILNGNEQVKFVFYDFHEKSLDWIKQLKETWDGDDFPKYLAKQSDDFKQYYKYINGSIEENQKLLFSDFGGEEQFKELWNRFKSCEVEYVKCNLFELDEVKSLLSRTVGDTPFFFYSNIFATDYTMINFTLDEITKKYNDFLDSIFSAYPTAITNGSTQLGDWVEYTVKDRPMKTLRVYGDSFGANIDSSIQTWAIMLAEKLQIPLVNKAVNGSSTEYAALQFVNDVQNNIIGNNDIIIYIPSTKGRLHFDFQISSRPETASGYCHGPDTRAHIDNSWYYKSKDHIEWWMVNASHDIISMNFESYTHVISNVARSKPNAIFIMIKHIDWDHHIPNINHPANFLIPTVQFTNITSNEIIGGYNYMDFVEFTKYDPRANHLTIPNLKILSELVYETINTRSVENFTMDKFKTNVIEKITTKEQYLEYVNQGYLDYSYHILRNLSNL